MPMYVVEFEVSGGWGEYTYTHTHKLISEDCNRKNLTERIRNKMVRVLRGDNDKTPTYFDPELCISILSVFEIKEVLNPRDFADCARRAIVMHANECKENRGALDRKRKEESEARERAMYEKLCAKYNPTNQTEAS